jgi:hypothetical protein
MVDSTKAMLEAQLQALVEADGDAGEIGTLISRIDSMPEDGVELTAEALVIEPIVVPPTETQPLPLEKENNVTAMTLTKESLGIGGEFASELKGLSLDTIKSYIVDAPDYEDLEGLAFPGVSNLSSEYRVHLQQTGEVARAARGFAVFAAGGVSEGVITSPDGSIHFIDEDGVCYEKSLTKQPDSFTGSMVTIERIVECKGHKAYKNVGTHEEPKFKATGAEYTRCLHQWALMFAAGFYVTFSIDAHHDRVIFEIAKRVGDEKAREVAVAQSAEWAENSQVRFEERREIAQASQHVRNTMGLEDGARLPAAPDVLALTLPNGKTVKDSVLALGGARFVVLFDVPLRGETSRQKVRAGSLAELASRAAPIYAAARMQKTELVPVEVKAA